MKSEDWRVLMEALSLHAQAVPFAEGVDLETQHAITDHMAGVAEFIEKYHVPEYIKVLSEAAEIPRGNVALRAEVQQILMEAERLLMEADSHLSWAIYRFVPTDQFKQYVHQEFKEDVRKTIECIRAYLK